MRKSYSFILGLVVLLLSATAVVNYRTNHRGQLLYHTYALATPAPPVPDQRGLDATRATAEQAVLAQAERYLSAGQPDFALTALRNYLADNAAVATDHTFLLAALSALRTGAYEASAAYLEDTSPTNPDRLWMTSLLQLRRENLPGAARSLRQLRQDSAAHRFPVAALLAEIE